MKKRTLAAVLWSLSGWYLGALVAWLLNLGPIAPVIAIVLAFAAGAFIWTDPRRIIWTDADRAS
jgi:zinc transporter ZupT